MQEEKFQFSVNADGGEVVIRHGDALPLSTPKGVQVSGQIGSPVEFAVKMQPSPSESHVVANREKGSITLVCGHRLPQESQDVIAGSIQFHPHFEELQIDKGKWPDPAKLGELLRRRRRYFANEGEGLKLVSALKNFSAKVDKQLEKIDDKSARRYRSAVEKVVESNLPHEVKMRMPILKGFPDMEFNVEIALDVTDGGVSIWLESPELELILEEMITSAIDAELEQLQDYVIIEI